MLRRVALIAGVALGGCYGIDYSHDYDRREDFSALRTWAWSPAMASEAEHSSRISDLNRKRIEAAVESELVRRGYPRVDATSADFRVRYDAGVRERVQWDSVPHDYWYTGDAYVYDEGTLVVDFLRGEDERLIWRGAARTQVEFDMTPEERDESVSEAVRGILDRFPPKEKR